MLKICLSSLVVAAWLTACVVASPQAVPQPPPQQPQPQPQGTSSAASAGAPAQKPAAEVLQQDSFVGQDGYNFEFSSSDGTARQERGQLITLGDKQGIAINGSYTYAAPDGQHYRVTYTADQDGFKPEVHLLPADQQQPQQ